MRRGYDEKYRFLSTPSARRATAWSFATRSPTIISIHVLREEGDLSPCAALLLRLEFLSTPSARRATTERPAIGRHGKNFYPRPPRGGRPKKETAAAQAVEFLSTPSARRATFQHRYQERVTLISIHALREEGDALDYAAKIKHAQFLSTPSARRATSPSSSPMLATFQFLSTPSARRATLF